MPGAVNKAVLNQVPDYCTEYKPRNTYLLRPSIKLRYRLVQATCGNVYENTGFSPLAVEKPFLVHSVCTWVICDRRAQIEICIPV
ncbi:hypothetical protein HZ326_24953 [Fusarium oxysporum f. sp. albedinis]|nr:hypothetical protein HZ326_24953 [Fusarium oxysporum f. sp. albedinis]